MTTVGYWPLTYKSVPAFCLLKHLTYIVNTSNSCCLCSWEDQIVTRADQGTICLVQKNYKKHINAGISPCLLRALSNCSLELTGNNYLKNLILTVLSTSIETILVISFRPVKQEWFKLLWYQWCQKVSLWHNFTFCKLSLSLSLSLSLKRIPWIPGGRNIPAIFIVPRRNTQNPDVKTMANGA